MSGTDGEARLVRTRAAFDSVAADYDGTRTSALLRDMRADVWRYLEPRFAPGSRLLDIGCGPGEDAEHFAALGHRVTAIDWSPRMVERARARAAQPSLHGRLEALCLGAQQLERLPGVATFDGAYSNLGPLNCVPDLQSVAAQCARLLVAGAPLVMVVMGRWCPWEMVHYGLRGRWARIRVRFAPGGAEVGLNGHRVWTAYYTPREVMRAFARAFEFVHCRGLALCAPPPYLTEFARRRPRTYQWLRGLDQRFAGWPLLRQLGDHFILHLRRRMDVP
jgi:SAM-dependent methyltransferase